MGPLTPDGQLLNVAEQLAPPWMLLEDGAARGTRMLVWGAAARHHVAWAAGLADPRRLALPDGAWFGAIAYDAGLPPHAVRRAPVIAQPVMDLFRPTQRIVLRTGVEAECVGDEARTYWRETGDGRRTIRSTSDCVRAPDSRYVQEVRRPSPVSRSFDQSSFEHAVRIALDYIRAGDIYQVNLSVAERVPLREPPFDVYRRLRAINPSPWMGFADFGDWQLVCGSPELLVEVHDGRARARPIAGTRKKTGDPAIDQAMRAELRSDAKEAAEHIMLVDLARNDLGRVARPGTVRVEELGRIAEYSHVMHLESDVTADLAAGVGPREVFDAAFPGGTITGCPKIRAMEIIAELEPVARGMYTGALGWWEGGHGQWNILIRSAVVRGGEVLIQSGAGIVADSDPGREWKESLRKAAALREAFGAGRP